MLSPMRILIDVGCPHLFLGRGIPCLNEQPGTWTGRESFGVTMGLDPQAFFGVRDRLCWVLHHSKINMYNCNKLYVSICSFMLF